MRTITTQVYKFDELSDDAKQKALENLYDINVDYDWWESTLEFINEDYSSYGIDYQIKGFDTYRGDIESEYDINDYKAFFKALKIDARTKDAKYFVENGYFDTDANDNKVREFMRELDEDALKQLRLEYDYLTGEEAIRDTIEANEYEFTEDGVLA